MVDADVAHDDLLRAAVAIELVNLSQGPQAKFAEGLQWGDVARAALARAGGDESREAALENNMGNLFRSLARYDESTRAFDRSLELRRRLGQDDEIAATLNNEALVLWDTGELRRALELTQQSEHAMADSLGDEASFCSRIVLENEGNIWLDLGRPDEALVLHKRVGEIRARSLRRPRTRFSRPESLLSVGKSQAATGDLEGGDGMLRQALERIERSASEPAVLAEFQRELGMNDSRRGEWRTAEDRIRSSLAGYAKAFGTSHPEYARTLLCAATLEVDTGRPEQGELDGNQARAALEAAKGNAADLSRAWRILGEARLARAGAHEDAREAFAHAVDVLSNGKGDNRSDYAIARLRLVAMDLASGRALGEVPAEAQAAVESVAEMTDSESAFVRGYAAALLEWAARRGPARYRGDGRAGAHSAGEGGVRESGSGARGSGMAPGRVRGG